MGIAAGDVLGERELPVVGGGTVKVPPAEGLVHLQFRRFAGCPICNLHLRSVVRRHDELVAAGVHEVVVFHSGEDELRSDAAGLPFAVVADPDKRLYREFGVESSVRALLDPRVWPMIVWAIARSTVRIVRRQDRAPSLRPTNGRYGLPGDFLIGPGGQVLAAKHGVHADDQWSVDEVLALAAQPAQAGRAR